MHRFDAISVKPFFMQKGEKTPIFKFSRVIQESQIQLFIYLDKNVIQSYTRLPNYLQDYSTIYTIILIMSFCLL